MFHSITPAQVVIILLVLVLIVLHIRARTLNPLKVFNFAPAAHMVNAEAKLNMFEHSLNACFTTDDNQIVIAWNDRAEVFLGWSEEFMLGKKFSDFLIPTQDRAKHERGFAEYKLNPHSKRVINNPEGIELEVLNKNGDMLPIRLFVFEFISKAGFKTFGATIVDISREKEREKAYLSRIRMYELGEKISQSGNFILNVQTNIVECTKGFYALFMVDNMPASKNYFLDRVHVEDVHIPERAVLEAIKTGRGYYIEFRIPRNNGTCFLVSVTTEMYNISIADKQISSELVGVVRYLREVDL